MQAEDGAHRRQIAAEYAGAQACLEGCTAGDTWDRCAGDPRAASGRAADFRCRGDRDQHRLAPEEAPGAGPHPFAELPPVKGPPVRLVRRGGREDHHVPAQVHRDGPRPSGGRPAGMRIADYRKLAPGCPWAWVPKPFRSSAGPTTCFLLQGVPAGAVTAVFLTITN